MIKHDEAKNTKRALLLLLLPFFERSISGGNHSAARVLFRIVPSVLHLPKPQNIRFAPLQTGAVPPRGTVTTRPFLGRSVVLASLDKDGDGTSLFF